MGRARRWPRRSRLRVRPMPRPTAWRAAGGRGEGGDAPAAALPTATDIRRVDVQTATDDQCQLPARHRVQIRRPGPSRSAGAGAEARARALECLTSAIYYEAGQEGDDGPARGRAGGPQPRPPSGLSRQRLRRRLRRLDPADRLPVHLHLRRLAGPRRRCPMPGTARRAVARSGADGLRLCAGRQRHALSRQLCRALLGVDAWSRSQSIGAHIFYRWAGGWGQPGCFHPDPMRGREPNADALRAAAIALNVPHRDARSRRSRRTAIDEDRGRRRPSSRRCAATSACAVLFSRGARSGRRRSSTSIMSSGRRVRQSALDAGRRHRCGERAGRSASPRTGAGGDDSRRPAARMQAPAAD